MDGGGGWKLQQFSKPNVFFFFFFFLCVCWGGGGKSMTFLTKNHAFLEFYENHFCAIIIQLFRYLDILAQKNM